MKWLHSLMYIIWIGYFSEKIRSFIIEEKLRLYKENREKMDSAQLSCGKGEAGSPLDEKGSPENIGCCVQTGMSSSAMAYSQFLMRIGRLSHERRLRAVSSIYGLNNEIRFLSFLGSTQANARAPP